MKEYDLFISHASEDKDALVRPLAAALAAAGLTVWYDEITLKPADNLRRSMDEGLARSRFGLVVLSKAFFAKKWTNWELDGLVVRQQSGDPVIIPIWHDVNASDVMAFSPSLANVIAIPTTDGFANLVNSVVATVRRRGETRTAIPRQSPNSTEPKASILPAEIRVGRRLLSDFQRALEAEDDGALRELIMKNPSLLGLLFRHRRHAIVQTQPPPFASYAFDAFAISVPQWIQVTLFKIGDPKTPPFLEDGSWSSALLDAVGTVAGWAHSSGRHLLAVAGADLVGAHAREWEKHSFGSFDSTDRVACGLRIGENLTSLVILSGRRNSINEKARLQLQQARIGEFEIEVRSFDAILDALQDLRSRKRTFLG